MSAPPEKRAAAAALMEVFKHYARQSPPQLAAAIPPELDLAANVLRGLDGFDVARLVIERQQWLPFGER